MSAKKTEKLPAKERASINRKRIANLRDGSGDYTWFPRSWALKQAEDGLLRALEDMKREPL